MMRIAVTGAGGQLGRAFEKVATEANEWIFTDLAELNITDAEAVERFFESRQPDVLINCAAFTDVERAEAQRDAAFSINAGAVCILAEASARHGSVLVHISTDFVFGGDAAHDTESGRTHGYVPYKESDPVAPLNVYGESKLAGERAVAESGCRGAVVRTSWLYSPWGRNFVKTILGLAATRDEVRIVADQRGNPTSALSLAAAIVAILPELGRTLSPAEPYHFCDSGAVSRAEFAAEIIRQAGSECRVVPIPSAEFPSAARRPEWSGLDTEKITRTFGIATRPWREPLAECINDLKNGR